MAADQPATNPWRRRVGALVVALLLVIGAQYVLSTATQPKHVPYSELLDQIESDGISEVEITDTRIRAVRKDGAGVLISQRLPEVDQPQLLALLREHEVRITGRIERSSWWQTMIFGWLLPFAIIIGIYALFIRRVQRRDGGALTFGRSQAKIYDRRETDPVTFQDVAGVDEAVGELREVVDFLKNPDKYRALGARIPKGVLLVGAPGTGKTLLAKAVAGEADVPFFSMSGSEFVEMFVGVGAARMRSLFDQAKTRAPCIVFVDELDAIGKSRGGLGAMATHDEREQTLNQLLVEMDGFDPGTGVVIMAATNRPEVLDPALVRPGRFDRQVVVDRPDLQGRREILAVHVRRVVLADEVDIDLIARRTPGMVGADLANIVNEAALAAARRSASEVGQVDFEEAIDRVQLGLKKRSRAMNDDEKRRVAFHEGGHALVALSVEHADPVHRVTIVPRSIGALGATLQLPTEDRYLMTRAELLDRLCIMLGGRAAEELACGDVSTGAQNDLERASETARQMVCRFGMSEQLGAQTFGRALASQFLDLPVGEDRNYSEQTAQAIDAEVAAILDTQHQRARRILAERRDTLELIAARLLERETLDADELERMLQSPPSTGIERHAS